MTFQPIPVYSPKTKRKPPFKPVVLKIAGFNAASKPTEPKIIKKTKPKKKWTYEQLKGSDAMIPAQQGSNQFASQKGMTGFGVPRDVKGKHTHRWFDGDLFPSLGSGRYSSMSTDF